MLLSPQSKGKKPGSSSSSSPHCCEESTGPCSTFNTVIKTIPKHIQTTLTNGILTCKWLLLAHDTNTLALVLGLTSKYSFHKLPPTFDVYLAAITNFYDCDSRSHEGVWSPDFESQAVPLILISKWEAFWIPKESNLWFCKQKYFSFLRKVSC